MSTSTSHRPVHGGYPGIVPGPSLDLRKGDTGYKGRVFNGPFMPEPDMGPYPLGTESEEHIARLAEAFPQAIYFVTEEASA